MLYYVNKEAVKYWINIEKRGEYMPISLIKRELTYIVEATRKSRYKDGYQYKHRYKNYILTVNESSKSIEYINETNSNAEDNKLIEELVKRKQNNKATLYFLTDDILNKYRTITNTELTLPILKRQLSSMIHSCKKHSKCNEGNNIYHFNNVKIKTNENIMRIEDIWEINLKPENQEELYSTYIKAGQALGLNEDLSNFKRSPKDYTYKK